MTTLLVVSLGLALFALLLRVRNDWKETRERELVEAWEPCMLDVLAGDAPDAALLTLVKASDAPQFLSFLLGYARRLRGAERLTVVRLAQPYLWALAARAHRGGPEKRAHAIQLLAALGLPEHADTVAAGLDDHSPFVAMIAARGLFRRGYEQYHAVVLQHLPRFTLWSRSFLSSMLARGGLGTAPFLRETFADPDGTPLVRAIVADALRLLNDIEAASIAAQVLSDRQQRTGSWSPRAFEFSGTSDTRSTSRSSDRSSPPPIP